MATPIKPMKAVSADGLPPDESPWAFEVKWDGMRVLTVVAQGVVTAAWSGNGTDALRRFPELARLGPALTGHRRVVLDGEVVAIDPTTGRPDFGRLQRRMQSSTPAAIGRAAQEVSITYVAFDLLELDDTSLLDLGYEQRRAVLDALLEPGAGWMVAASHDDGETLLEAVRRQGLEGIIAKRRDSRYEPGRRSPAWLKVKVRLHQELVVGGWLPGAGARAPTFGALLLGYHDPPGDDRAPAGPLRFAGRVGTGFSDDLLRRLRRRLDSLAIEPCPFEPPPPSDVVRKARWVRPEIVVEVAHAEWTADGVLRHPSYLGERLDKDAATVGREP